jgi:hypothetical protein
METFDGGSSFVIMSGPEEDAREIGELAITEDPLSDEDLVRLAGTLSAISKMILVELGMLKEEDMDPDFQIDKTKNSLH